MNTWLNVGVAANAREVDSANATAKPKLRKVVALIRCTAFRVVITCPPSCRRIHTQISNNAQTRPICPVGHALIDLCPKWLIVWGTHRTSTAQHGHTPSALTPGLPPGRTMPLELSGWSYEAEGSPRKKKTTNRWGLPLRTSTRPNPFANVRHNQAHRSNSERKTDRDSVRTDIHSPQPQVQRSRQSKSNRAN